MNLHQRRAREKYLEHRRGRRRIPYLDEMGVRCLIDNGFELQVILNKIGGKYLAFFASPASPNTYLVRISANQFQNESIKIPEITRELMNISGQQVSQTIPTKPRVIDRVKDVSVQVDPIGTIVPEQKQEKQVKDASTQTSLSYFIWDTV